MRISSADYDKIQRYSDYFLKRFRDDVAQLEAKLQAAHRRLAIAEIQHAEGKQVTGTADGIADILRPLLAPHTMTPKPLHKLSSRHRG